LKVFLIKMKVTSPRWLQVFISVVCLVPFLLLVIRFFIGRLGADPVQTLILSTGDWTMRFLLLTLVMTPVQDLSGWKGAYGYRRTLGLFSLFYASLHFLVYIGLSYLFDFTLMVEEALRSPFVIVGFGSFLLLILLGVTSLRAIMGRMSRRDWRIVHSLVYVISVGGTVHYLLKLKVISREFLLYTVILSLLLLYRIVALIFIRRFRKRGAIAT
jgi:sulfoxide reductase heme-binding subunit YedZ